MLAYSSLVPQRTGTAVAGAGFPPSGRGLSLPAAHRRILVWLLQDLVLWFVQSDQIRHFRPRRN